MDNIDSQEQKKLERKAREKQRREQARIEAEKHRADRELVAKAMRHILTHPEGATPSMLIFAAETLDHIEYMAGAIPDRAFKVMDAEPPDLEAFKKAVDTLTAIKAQANTTE